MALGTPRKSQQRERTLSAMISSLYLSISPFSMDRSQSQKKKSTSDERKTTNKHEYIDIDAERATLKVEKNNER